MVFISSVSTFNVKVGNSLYSATKGAVNSFAKAMALEVSKQEMRVNCIQPGFIPSSILSSGAIEEDAFLGGNCTILPYKKVGAGATVGAAAVVTKDVAPGQVVKGNPAK